MEQHIRHRSPPPIIETPVDWICFDLHTFSTYQDTSCWFFLNISIMYVFQFLYVCLLYLASSSGKRWSAHCVVRAHKGLPAGHHPYWLWGCTDHHLPNEEPHVLYSDHEETTGMPTAHVQVLHVFMDDERMIKCLKYGRTFNNVRYTIT